MRACSKAVAVVASSVLFMGKRWPILVYDVENKKEWQRFANFSPMFYLPTYVASNKSRLEVNCGQNTTVSEIITGVLKHSVENYSLK